MEEYGDKDAYTEATIASDLRAKITAAAESAVEHHVNRDWVNGWLRRLGAKQITGPAEYRMNIPLTGSYGWRCNAGSRAEAAQRFLEQVQRVMSQGKITADGSYDNVYDVKFNEPVTASDVVFYAGPEDPAETDDPIPGLDALKVEIRKMLMEGVAEQGWGRPYANHTLASMDLEALPALKVMTVDVPVSGVYKAKVAMFPDATDEDVQRAAMRLVRRMHSVVVTPDEVGTVTAADEPGYGDLEVEDDPF